MGGYCIVWCLRKGKDGLFKLWSVNFFFFSTSCETIIMNCLLKVKIKEIYRFYNLLWQLPACRFCEFHAPYREGETEPQIYHQEQLQKKTKVNCRRGRCILSFYFHRSCHPSSFMRELCVCRWIVYNSKTYFSQCSPRHTHTHTHNNIP